jgi:hypothetical protein
VAVHLGATSAVLAGVPLDYRQGHFNKAAPWADGANYRKGWVDHVADMINVRSMSGWTRELLGAPDAAWLDGADLDASPNAYQGAIP